MNCQSKFFLRWQNLQDQHVRALAWLIDSPDLLDPNASQWQGKIASLDQLPADGLSDYLSELDRNPGPLHTRLEITPFTRLGRYAEALMAFYFEHLGILAAHGVPVREGKNITIGEFDFLLKLPQGLVHWEFATKLYLLEASGKGQHVDYFVGPNLNDTLGAKVGKILERQLKLAEHPEAQVHLPEPVVSAQALVKGWLFYREDDASRAQALGVSPDHCHGFWRPYAETGTLQHEAYAILPRLQWLAPATLPASQSLSLEQLRERLNQHFKQDSMPVLIACLVLENGKAAEAVRGFIVPDDWQVRAGLRARRTLDSYARKE